MLHIRDQEIFHACQSARTCDGINGHNDGEHNESRHHDTGNLLHTLLHAEENDNDRADGKDQEPSFHGYAVGDEFREEIVAGQRLNAAADVSCEIADYPAADHAVIGSDDHRNDSVDPSAETVSGAFSKMRKCTDWTLPCHSADCCLRDDQRVAEGQHEDQVHQQKNTAAVFGSEIRKSPDVTQAHRGTRCCQYITQSARKSGTLRRTLIAHKSSSLSYVIFFRKYTSVIIP